MQTVQDGAFDCRAGQILQCYFVNKPPSLPPFLDFEADMFYRENTEDRKTRRHVQEPRRQRRS